MYEPIPTPPTGGAPDSDEPQEESRMTNPTTNPTLARAAYAEALDALAAAETLAELSVTKEPLEPDAANDRVLAARAALAAAVEAHALA